MSEVANKLCKAAMGGYDGCTGTALDNAKQLFGCEGRCDFTLLYRIADEIEAEQGACKEVEGVTESFDVPRDCEFVPVHPFHTQCTSKEQACKVLEEAAEVFGAWQTLDLEYARANDEKPYMPVLRDAMADEIADVIQAACNLAYRYGIDVSAAMKRCEQRNRERGRYGE